MKAVIFGNAGSGKSTLAQALARKHAAAHLDLDTIAWQAAMVRAPFDESRGKLLDFIAQQQAWVIEGCYAELLRVAAPHCSQMIFLNPGIDACIANCRSRPWEPHKYPSKEAQDAQLQPLLDWVREYETRSDEFSLREHRRLYEEFGGKKVEYRTNAVAP